MSVREDAITIACESEQLLGIVSQPQSVDAATGDLGVVIVVGGPQYRVGSHRQFVLLARRLAADGFPVLRFDYRGMGDAGGAQRSFEAVGADIGAAIDAFSGCVPRLRRVVLWGLCDGASAALLYTGERHDVRVVGLCLLNPWVRSEATLARTHVQHYYARRLRERDFWLKLLRGGVATKAFGGLLRNLMLARRAGRGSAAAAAAPYTARMAAAWRQFGGRLLLVMSGDDYTAKEFAQSLRDDPAWRGADSRDGLERLDLPGTDHTLSDTAGRLAMEDGVLKWLKCLERRTGPAIGSHDLVSPAEDLHAPVLRTV